MAIYRSRLIAWTLMLPVASDATTASLSQCRLIPQALDLVVQVRSACRTAYISLQLMCLAVFLCGTVVLKSWAGVLMLDKLAPGLRK
jgi:hypothetical protein